MLPTELDINSAGGLTQLFWFAINARGDDTSQAEAALLKDRLDLNAVEPNLQGAFEDAVRHLDSLEPAQRFEAVCSLIAGALKATERLDSELQRELLHLTQEKRIVRFSFVQGLLLCLRHAQAIHTPQVRQSFRYNVRYAGLRPDRDLMATASLYLNLPLYTESGPPWAPDKLFDDGEPNFEPPDLEISFPPATFRSSNAPELEPSIRKMGLPRAVDRGTYDLESVMLGYLCDVEVPAIAMVSASFLSSPKLSRATTRRHLLDARRVQRVAERKAEQEPTYLITLCNNAASGNVQMTYADTVKRFTGTDPFTRSVRGRSDLISVDKIENAGGILLPRRFLSDGVAGGSYPSGHLANVWKPADHILSDLFEVIRPKTLRHDPVGTFEIREVRGMNITQYGELRGVLRSVSIRSTREVDLERQRLRPGDIVFAHRGPIGRVAYVSEKAITDMTPWAGQTLFIFRERKRYAGAPIVPYCDPRVLFMYLLSPKVQESWKNLASGKRSPAIPIGEVEHFALPSNVMVDRKPKKAMASTEIDPSAARPAEVILSEFARYQQRLAELLEVEAQLDESLDTVWEVAWH